jgi:N utilization substance protein A
MRRQHKKTPAKKAAPKKATVKKKIVRGKSQSVATVAFEPEGRRARSGGQTGDLQGLVRTVGSDSESVDDLLEEGNAFEAEVVKGVQDAPDADESEVVTHEVPEDDVSEEYLDKE